MSARSRRKGAQWERDLANRWKTSGLFPEAHRGPWGMQRKGEADVEGTPYHVECKVGARPNLLAAVIQAEFAAGVAELEGNSRRPAIVVAKRDREEPVVCMRLDTFELLAQCAQGRFTMSDVLAFRAGKHRESDEANCAALGEEAAE